MKDFKGRKDVWAAEVVEFFKDGMGLEVLQKVRKLCPEDYGIK